MRRARSISVSLLSAAFLATLMTGSIDASTHAGAVIPPFRSVYLAKGLAPIADNETAMAEWGRVMAHDGQRVILGAGDPWLGVQSAPFSKGVAEIWEHSGDVATGAGWRRVADLIPPGGMLQSDEFGRGVAIEGDIAVVAAPNRKVGTFSQAGTVYVFRRQPNGSWESVQTLTSSAPSTLDHFGSSIALENGRLVVGTDAFENRGAASLFEQGKDGMFGPEILIEVPGAAIGDQWGYSVGIDGETIVVGGPFATVGKLTQAGAVATFVLSPRGGAPTFEGLLTLPPADFEDARFGRFLAFDDGILAVTSPLWHLDQHGAAHCFRRTVGGWDFVGAVYGSQLNEYLGRVAVEGDRLCVSSPRFMGVTKGFARLYQVGATELTLLAERTGSTIESSLGAAVGLMNDWWFIREELPNYNDQPTLHSIRLGDVEGDCDGNRIPNGIEVTVNGAPDCNENLVPDTCELAANDCDDSGTLDACDVATIDVASTLGNDYPISLGPALDATNASIFLNRIDVPRGMPLGVTSLVSVGSRTASTSGFGNVPCYVAVYADGDADGLPGNLELIEAWSTFFPASPEEFELKVGPIPVVPGSTLFVALAFAPPAAQTNSTYLRTQTPYVAGYNWFAIWPFATLDFEAIGQSATFAELSVGLEPDLNVVCFAHFASSADSDHDGAVDVCECPADFSGDGTVGPEDLAQLLGAWLTPNADLDNDGTTGASDLAILLGAWGGC